MRSRRTQFHSLSNARRYRVSLLRIRSHTRHHAAAAACQRGPRSLQLRFQLADAAERDAGELPEPGGTSARNSHRDRVAQHRRRRVADGPEHHVAPSPIAFPSVAHGRKCPRRAQRDSSRPLPARHRGTTRGNVVPGTGVPRFRRRVPAVLRLRVSGRAPPDRFLHGVRHVRNSDEVSPIGCNSRADPGALVPASRDFQGRSSKPVPERWHATCSLPRWEDSPCVHS